MIYTIPLIDATNRTKLGIGTTFIVNPAKFTNVGIFLMKIFPSVFNTVNSIVFVSSKKLEIFNSIIKGVAIYVMNYLRFGNRSADFFGHNFSVNRNISSTISHRACRNILQKISVGIINFSSHKCIIPADILNCKETEKALQFIKL